MSTRETWITHNNRVKENIAYSVFKSNLKQYIYHGVKIRGRSRYCWMLRLRSNGLIVIIGAYILLFLTASIILLVSVLQLQRVSETNHFQLSNSFQELNHNSTLNKYTVEQIFSKRLYREFIWPFKHPKYPFNCSILSVVDDVKYVSSGWTKSVYSFQWSDKSYALKTVNVNGWDVQNCMKKELFETCYQKAASKIYKEVILSRELLHDNILKVHGYCVSDDSALGNIAVVTELCSPVTTIVLLQMTFKERLKIALELSNLISYLSKSPLGPIAMNDFRRQQFVLCNGTLRLTDLDDMSVEEPKCSESKHCLRFVKKSHENGTQRSDDSLNKHIVRALSALRITCTKSRCTGYNERQNIINMYKHFVSLFLPINVPPMLRLDIKNYLSNFLNPQWDASVIFKQTEKIYFRLNHSNPTKGLVIK